MIPFAPQLAVAAACLAVGFGTGWKVQGWRWDASLKEQAESRVEAVNQARNREHEMATVQATIAETLERSKVDALRKKDAVIADLRAGTIRLPLNPGLPRPGESAASTCERDAAATRQFLGPFLEATATLHAEADLVAEQLAACQAIVKADRK
tara:strand:- start:37 stop:495 length:459 start_codon:yes stop_codon:yes gene_type:complete